MIYVIRIISEESDDFFREIHISSQATFLDLHSAILDACAYTDSQITSFFLCDEAWHRGIEITREDMGLTPANADVDIYVMDTTPLSTFIDDTEQRLEYVFDPFSDRSFAMEVVKIIPKEKLETPLCVKQKGQAPEQISEMGFDALVPTDTPTSPKASKSTHAEIDDTYALYGDEDFNADEFDYEGFEITED